MSTATDTDLDNIAHLDHDVPCCNDGSTAQWVLFWKPLCEHHIVFLCSECKKRLEDMVQTPNTFARRSDCGVEYGLLRDAVDRFEPIRGQ